jgi:hypothetical protein
VTGGRAVIETGGMAEKQCGHCFFLTR